MYRPVYFTGKGASSITKSFAGGESPMTRNIISRSVRSVSFVQAELFLAVAEDEDAARLFYALLKDEHEVEKVFGEFLVSGHPTSVTSIPTAQR